MSGWVFELIKLAGVGLIAGFMPVIAPIANLYLNDGGSSEPTRTIG